MGDRHALDWEPLRALFDTGVVGDLTDLELLGRYASQRDAEREWAFSALVARHGPMVLRACRDVVRDPHLADDAFQATFLVLARRAGSLWVRDSLGPWLHEVACRIAARARADLVRKRYHEQRAAEMRTRTSHDRGWDDQAAVLHQEIERLPARYRVPVVLCYLEGLTSEQAAHQLGWPVGTVRSRLARARQRLKSRLVRRGLGPAAALSAIIVLPANLTATPISPAMVGAAVRLGIPAASTGTLAKGLTQSVATLFKGEMTAMNVAKFKVAVLALAVGTISLTVAIGYTGLVPQKGDAARDDGGRSATEALKGQAPGRKKTTTEDETNPSREARHRIAESIKRLERALFEYHNDQGHYPSAVINDKDNRPLLSWRVALLPYLGEGELFREFKRDEAWDGPHNLRLLAKMPGAFAPPEGTTAAAHSTFYQAIVGPGTAWEEGKELAVPRDFPDGTNNTIQLVEASRSVPWTKPEDVVYAQGRPLPNFGCLPTQRRFWAGFVDGHLRDFSWTEISQENRHALITRNGRDFAIAQ
jgi:RNA polymerase sigma factor (sigma-70 family)